jgi:hypothetical protein
MFQTAGDPDFRPLFHETIALAWNAKLWRFPGQENEFPEFVEINWKKWLDTDWGKRWLAGENRAPQDKMSDSEEAKINVIL